MRKFLILLMVGLGLVFGPVAGDATAATKKKVTVTKRHTKAQKVVVKKHVTIKHHKLAKHKRHPHEELAAVADDGQDPVLHSASALVTDQSSGAVLYEKNANAVLPIASITKLMTAMIALDARPGLNDVLTIDQDDVDVIRGSRSHLRVGTQLSREEMLRLALMASENRAASALSRNYPGGRGAFVAAMNNKARVLGLTETHFEDPTGLTSANVSSARDLSRLVAAAHEYPLIREFTTTPEYEVTIAGRPRMFHNTNRLVGSSEWSIGLSKTGYINEAGKCLVMQAWVNNKPTIIVLLDSAGKLTRIGDANRIRRWIEHAALPQRQATG
jgi:serine-type D-Ala-D-Ala endopeptidase (penicillin-binding protein 7)